MILMIVEDEKTTREGLAKCLDWAQVGVSKVFCAENGEEGLALAKRARPDIVLTDIRMPRMDGITMAGRIRELLPECCITFLSAYSEIDYYKAAIDLKVVRYLDKPVDTERLRAVILKCVAECAQRNQYKNTLDLQQLREKRGLADAICLNADAAEIKKELKRVGFAPQPKGGFWVTAVIVGLRMHNHEEVQEDHPALAARLGEALPFPHLHTVRHKSRLVFFLFTPAEPTARQLEAACAKLKAGLDDRLYALVVGKTVHGVAHANKSYNAAKAMMAKAYCHPWCEAVLFDEALLKTAGVSAYGDARSQILAAVREDRQADAIAACGALYETLKARKDLAHEQARELCIDIASEVYRRAEALHLQIREDEAAGEGSWIARLENHNLDEMHAFLCGQIGLLFDAKQNARTEKRQILAIKDYIAKNYTNDALSISDISDFMHISASHLCTMFKRETGDTINTWMTAFRLDKAKQYLRESPLSVAEISEKVGYQDNSYFGRLFRKHFGMTPNEYRNGPSHA